MFKLKKKLIPYITVLLISGFLLTSLASYFISMTSLRDQVTQSGLPLTSDNIYSEIQRDILRPIFISSLMASDTFLRDWVINGENDQEAILRYLLEIKEKNNTITAFFVSEQTRNYYHPDGLVKQVRLGEKRDAWYFRVRDMADEYEINVDIDAANKDTLTVFVNYKVYDYENKFIGATGVGLTVDTVRQLIKRYQQDYDRDILFVDSQGRVKISIGLTSGMQKQTQQLLELIQDKEFLGKITAADSTSLQFNLDGHPILLNSRFIDEFGWYLLVLQSEVKGAGKLGKTLLINILICAVITFVVLILTNRTISSYQQDIEKMATTDKLTGLFNRQAFDMCFNRIILKQKRKQEDLSLLLLDIDHFKQINDEHGHLAGDAVLVHFAALLTSRLRQTDIICRWGGEEFLILLKDCNLEAATRMAEEMCVSIANTPLSLKDEKIEITASIGISEYQSEDSEEQLIGRADRALYEAKSSGRNKVVSFQ